MMLEETNYSAWAGLAKTKTWKALISPIGYLLGYPAWALVQISWVMMRGKWAHVTTGKHEFVPLGEKRERLFPPLIFEGRVREIQS